MSHKKPKGKPNRTPSPSAQQASSVDAAVDALQALTGIATGDGRPCEIRVLRMPGRRHICTITPDQMTADEFAATFGSGDYLLQLAPVGGGSIIAGPTYSVDALWGEGNVDRINALFRGVRNRFGIKEVATPASPQAAPSGPPASETMLMLFLKQAEERAAKSEERHNALMMKMLEGGKKEGGTVGELIEGLAKLKGMAGLNGSAEKNPLGLLRQMREFAEEMGYTRGESEKEGTDWGEIITIGGNVLAKIAREFKSSGEAERQQQQQPGGQVVADVQAVPHQEKPMNVINDGREFRGNELKSRTPFLSSEAAEMLAPIILTAIKKKKSQVMLVDQVANMIDDADDSTTRDRFIAAERGHVADDLIGAEPALKPYRAVLVAFEINVVNKLNEPGRYEDDADDAEKGQGAK